MNSGRGLPDVEIIAVGSELLTPSKLDTNSLWLTERLNALGLEVVRKSVVGDDRERLEAAIPKALYIAELVDRLEAAEVIAWRR